MVVSKVGVVATSGVVTPEILKDGVQKLEALGVSVAVGASVHLAKGYLAGEASQRWAALRGYAGSPFHLIIGARGGFGALDLLGCCDESTLKALPSIMGFSDMSALLVHLVSLGSVVVHGPTVQSLATACDRTLKAVAAYFADGHLTSPLADGWEVVVAGSGSGVLSGGNLITLASLCGTPWQLQCDGQILAIEEVNEAPYRIDRALTQLLHAGSLRGVRGVMVGECKGCGDKDRLSALFKERLAPLGVPILSGGLFGHGETNLPMAFGLRASLSSTEGFSYV